MDGDTQRSTPPVEQLRSVRRWLVPVAALAGVLVVIALAASPFLRREVDQATAPARQSGALSTSPSGATASPPDAWPTLPTDSGTGVPVSGRGELFREGDGPIRLCRAVETTSDGPPPSNAGCRAASVITSGVDPSILVHTTEYGQAYSELVTVDGVYRDGQLFVSTVEPVVESCRPNSTDNPCAGDARPRDVETCVPGSYQCEPVLPCVEPAAGWRPQAGAPVDDGTSYEDLIAFISANRDRFTEVWEAHPDGPVVDETTYLRSRKVMVVGTTGDVDAARAELSAIWPGNLCVHPVRYAAADLERIADRLNAVTTTSIEAFVDVRANRVKVSVVALDQQILSILDDFDREVIAILRPLLQ